MAEVVGVIAGSLEIGRTILKCRQLCKSIKDAPKDITALLDEATLINNLLGWIEQRQPEFAADAVPTHIWANCCASCKAATHELRTTVEQLNKNIHKARIRGSFKVVFKENIIAAQEKRLERAKLNLILVQQTLLSCRPSQQVVLLSDVQALLAATTNSTTNSTKQIQAPNSGLYKCTQSRLVDKAACSDQLLLTTICSPVTHNCIHNENNDGDIEVVSNSASKTRNQKRPRTLAKYYFVMPSWFTSCVYEVQARRYMNTWTINLRQYNRRPANDLIFKYAKNGNVEGLQELFSLGQASVYDRAVGQMSLEETPLHIATRYCQVEVAQFLIHQGADINAVDCLGYSCLHSMAIYQRVSNNNMLLSIIRLLVVEHEIDDLYNNCISDIVWRIAYKQRELVTTEVLDVLLQYTWPSYCSQDQNMRIDHAIWGPHGNVKSDVFWKLLGCHSLNISHLQTSAKYESGEDLITKVINTVARLAAQTEAIEALSLEPRSHVLEVGQTFGTQKYAKDLLVGWREILRQIIELGGLEIENSRGVSTVWEFLQTFVWYLNWFHKLPSDVEAVSDSVNLGFKLWVQELISCGISEQGLIQYARMEQDFILSNWCDIDHRYRDDLTGTPGTNYCRFLIVNLACEADVSQWSIKVLLSGEQYFSEFWACLTLWQNNEFESSSCRVPGQWLSEVQLRAEDDKYTTRRCIQFDMVSSRRKRRRALRYMHMDRCQETELFGPEWHYVVLARARKVTPMYGRIWADYTRIGYRLLNEKIMESGRWACGVTLKDTGWDLIDQVEWNEREHYDACDIDDDY